MLRSCLRAVDAISSISGSSACAPFQVRDATHCAAGLGLYYCLPAAMPSPLCSTDCTALLHASNLLFPVGRCCPRSLPVPPPAPQAFLRRVVQVPPLREKYSLIQKERAEAGGADAMDLS